MAEEPFYSSQGSQYERHQILLHDQENVGSSPSETGDAAQAPFSCGLKPKKPPTVTPKRFTKFFTPRSSLSTKAGQSKAGRQLRDITKNGINGRRSVQARRKDAVLSEEHILSSQRSPKRRRFSTELASSPPQSSPLKHVQRVHEIPVFEDDPTSPILSDEGGLPDLFEPFQTFPKRIHRLHDRNHAQRILQRSFGGYDALTRGQRGFGHCTDWRTETANFVSTHGDVHAFHGTALPFCTTSCNTNSLIAIGDEEGGIRLIDSASTSDFATAYVSLRPHCNAVMDIAFSSDDYQLATASGDQTARIVDMHTQQTVCILSTHKSSVKQVRFRPNDDSMVTTSSRDGSVLVWDLRCAANGAVQNLHTSFARAATADGDTEPAVRYAKDAVNVGPAHRSSSKGSHSEAAAVSITAIEHLPNGREHLLLTASELNASVKLWDLRHIARLHHVPISSTPLPESHIKTRNFGLNAMLISGDGARLYTVCRDATVYAYSTQHLVLGCAPELASTASRRRTPKESKTGVGPLYAFRHPQFRASSFYVKAALRPARDDKSEMLAVGSTDRGAVVFPLDERRLRRTHPQQDPAGAEDDEDQTGLPCARVLTSEVSATSPHQSSLPIHEQGTALIRGHHKEVTSLTWSHGGELVTVSDDFTARCWREDTVKARELRRCGETGGRRWGCGWADVDAHWDEDDG